METTMTIEPVDQELDQIAEQINSEHAAAERAMRDAFTHARRCGELLLQAKAAVPHGQFMRWVRDRCAFAHRTGTMYMRIAREWERITANWQSVANFGIVATVRWLSGADELPTSDEGTERPGPYAPAMLPIAELRPERVPQNAIRY